MRQEELHFKTHPTCTISVDQISFTQATVPPIPRQNIYACFNTPLPCCKPFPCRQRLLSQCSLSSSHAVAAGDELPVSSPFIHLENPSGTTRGDLWYLEHKQSCLHPRTFPALNSSTDAFTICNDNSSYRHQQVGDPYWHLWSLPKPSLVITTQNCCNCLVQVVELVQTKHFWSDNLVPISTPQQARCSLCSHISMQLAQAMLWHSLT